MEMHAPTGPDSVHIGTVCHLDNELDIAIVVVVGTARDLHKLVSHADVLRINAHVLGCGHGDQSNRALIAKGLVGPAANAADELHRGNAVVGNQHTAHAYVASGLTLTGKSSQTISALPCTCGMESTVQTGPGTERYYNLLLF